MWFVGMIVGAVLGTLIGLLRDVEVALVIGAVAGLFIGLAFQKTKGVVNEKWKRDVEEALTELHRRVKAMEMPRAEAASADAGAPVTATAADLFPRELHAGMDEPRRDDALPDEATPASASAPPLPE